MFKVMATDEDELAEVARSLQKQMTPEQVEAEHPFLTVERRPPASRCYKSEWDDLKSKMRDGDELWWYFVQRPVRYGGIALVRGGNVIDHITLMIV